MIEHVNRYWYSWKPVASINSGIRSWNNLSYISLFVGKPVPGPYDGYSTRAFAWEADPVDPSSSSPWHNYIYERVIDDYQWGVRAFAFWLPYGDYNINPTTGGFSASPSDYMTGSFGLSQILHKKAYTSIPSGLSSPNSVFENIPDPLGKQRLDLLARCPARWKGFKEAIKALVEGNLIPAASTGRAPINEPCRVMVYLGSCRGWPGYRYRSNLLWDHLCKSCGLSRLARTARGDKLFYQYLDEWIADIIAMKGSSPGTSENLSITLDAIGPSATPQCVQLFRTMPDYRSDMLELADWYVLKKLEEAGIETFYETRGQKRKSRASVPNSDDGGNFFPASNLTPTGGEGAAVANPGLPDEKSSFPFVEDEDLFWINESRKDNVVYANTVYSEEVGNVLRLMDVRSFPPRGDGGYSGDVYGAQAVFLRNGNSYPITSSTSPHARMWWTYALTDSYKYLWNTRIGQRFADVRSIREHVASYIPQNFRDGVYTEGAFNGVNNPDFAYWKLDLKTYDYRPMFDAATFDLNPSGYGGGWWTTGGKSAWDDMFRDTSLTGFLTKLDGFAGTTAPKDSESELPKYPNDPFTTAVIS